MKDGKHVSKQYIESLKQRYKNIKNNNYSMVYTPFGFSPHRAQLEEAFGKNLLRLAKSIPPPVDSR